MKKFNVTGICIPQKHYMVDTTNKIKQIAAMVDAGEYFTINRARQYGKTTTFSRLADALKGRYLVIRISFEGIGAKGYASEEDFICTFVNKVENRLGLAGVDDAVIREWAGVKCRLETKGDLFDVLGSAVTGLCKNIGKPVLLMIDEVDKSSDNQIFLNFLGMLRNKYLDAQEQLDVTFHSVILAGVYDIKNLKLKIRGDEEKKYNSPWNVAADFDIDMSFSAEEIVSMLAAYEEEHRVGMDLQAVSERIYFYTGGYPFLVSWLCKWMDEKNAGRFDTDSVDMAFHEILGNDNTLLDDLAKNVENYPELGNMVENILFGGIEYPFEKSVPVIGLGAMLGIFVNRGKKTAISNIIFETCLYNKFLLQRLIKGNHPGVEHNQFIQDGKLNMCLVLEKFREIMFAEYREADGKFYEKQGGLLFLCFLKPIINGTGYYFVEPQTRNNGRMDIAVVYGKQQFLIELKLWHGEQYRRKGLQQLDAYMNSRNEHTGYLVSFNFNRRKENHEGHYTRLESGRMVYEVEI